ncbi:MAG: GNAT family N-acetyltransferase [Thermodesulfobacteriota bacterium]
MAEKCEYSRLTLPNDRSYVDVAAAYVRAVAAKIGFEEEDIRSIDAATREAVSNVVEHAFEPWERAELEVSCERVPLGLKIVVRDKGIPFDPTTVPECEVDPSEGPGPGCGVFAMKEHMDEVSFHNLGRDGKESVLVKYLRNRDITDYFEACELEPFVPELPERREPGPIVVRALQPSEAAEVSRCMYRAYGYSHTFESMYYPERIMELNERGEMYSAVAVTQDGEVAGHAALLKGSTGARIAETGLGVVKPEFRGHGIFGLLEDHMIARGKEEGLLGLYGRAVTSHTYSQRTGHRHGVNDCALMVGLVPQTAWFRGIAEKLTQRESIVVHFKYLEPPEPVTVYAPVRQEAIIRRLYENIQGSVRYCSAPEMDESSLVGEPLIKTQASSTMSFARMDVDAYGQGIVKLVRARLRELCVKRFDIIHLYLSLLEPATAVLTPRFEELGFFFCGILPGALPGDALILQYLNNVFIDYDKIQVASEMARELVSYVRSLDPNQPESPAP